MMQLLHACAKSLLTARKYAYQIAAAILLLTAHAHAQLPSPTGINGSSSVFTGGPLGTAVSTVTVTPPTSQGCIQYGWNYQSNLNGFYVTTTGSCVTPFAPASMWSNPVLSGGGKTVTLTMPSTSVSGCVSGAATRSWPNPTLTLTITSVTPSHVWTVNTGTGVISAPVSFGGGSLVFTVSETINGSGGAQVNSVDITGCSGSVHECSSLNFGWYNGTTPTNDNCASAINIAAFPFNSGITSNACATDDGPTSTCPSGAPFKNLWYRVTGICGTLTASTCSANTNFDTEVAVFSGSTCGGLTSVACNNDNGPSCGGTKASVTWTSTAGTQYWISVGSVTGSSQTGDFQLDVTSSPFSNSTAPTGITGTTTICNGSSTTLTVSGGSLGAGATWQWFTGSCGGTAAGTGTSITVSPTSTTTYFVRASGTCNTTTCASQVVTVNPMVAASVMIFSSANPICSGDAVTFFAFPSNGGSSPSYQWKLNGANVGTNSATYVNSTLNNGDQITCVMTSNAPCVTGSPATSNTITMTVAPSVPVSVNIQATDTTICAGTNVTFLALPNNQGSSPTFQWKINGINVGTNSPVFASSTLNNGDVVTVVLTSSASCASGNPATSPPIIMVVSTSPTPTITPSGTVNICTGDNINLTSSNPSGNVWSTGATTSSINVTTAGSYTVYTVVSGCTSAVSSPTVVNVNPIPPTPTITPGGPTTFCASDSVPLSSSSASGNVWSNGATSISTTVNTSGSYTVYVVQAGCTSSVSTPVTVTVNPLPPTPTITPGGPTTFCTGGSVILTSSTASGNTWSTGATTQSITVSASGNYTVYAVASGCTSLVSAPTAVTVNPIPPTPTITPSGPTAFCAGGSVDLTSSATSGNNWSTGATSQTISVTASGSYTVYEVAAGCTSAVSASTVVTVTPLPPTPTITPSGATTFCAGGSVTLTSSAASGNTWSTGATTQSINVTASGSYTVYEVAAGCTSAVSTPVVVTVNPTPPTPVITPSGATTFCAGGSVDLTSSASSGNLWSNGATTQTISVTASGSYTVVEIAAGCTSAVSTPVVVTVNPIPPTPTITPSGATTFCAGGSVTLTSSAASGNNWSTGATTQNISVSASGSYTVYEVAAGCTSAVSTPVTVTVNPTPPTPTITPGGPTTFCGGGNVNLTSSAATGNLWSNGATTQVINVSASGSYTVVEIAAGCTSAVSTPVVVTVNPIPPTPVITPSGATTFCTGSSVTLTSSAAAGNNWSNGATTQAINVSTSGTFTVYEVAAGCTSAVSAPITVTVNPTPPTPTITPGGPTSFCAGGSVNLTSSAATGNLWSNGATSQTISASASGSYTVVEIAAGCTSAVSTPVVVTVTPLPPTPTISPSGAMAICSGNSVSLSSSSASGNIWSNGATSQSTTVSTSGSYTVYVVAAGCTSAVSTPTVVTVNPTPSQPTINPGGPTTFCAGGSVTLTSSAGSGNNWSNGFTTPSINATTSGTYTVYEVQLGCTSAVSAPVTVTVTPLPPTPTITPSGSTSLCTGGSVSLSSSSASGNVWSNGANSQSINVSFAGTYTVYVVAAGCTSAVSTPVTVTVNPIPSTPVITPNGPTTFCAGDSVILNSSAASGNNWSTGASTQAITVLNAGTYTVYAVVSGCTSAVSSPVSVTVNPNPAPPTITQNGNFLTANPAGTAYQWYLNGSPISGATGQTYQAIVSGNYTVVVTDANGCTSEQSFVYIFVGLASELQQAISVSPNPSSGLFKLQVTLPWLAAARVSVVNLEGKAVWARDYAAIGGNLDAEINLGAVANGMYFLRFETEEEVVMVKLVKQ